MSITRQLGKNTLGSGEKMTVHMKTYDRSTHDLSFAWRSTMGVGTLVPAMKLLALPGDTFDIDIDSLVFTNPTIGPLFGQFKMQVDVFTCPIRLYIAQLHNNTLGVAQNMQLVKLPKWTTTLDPSMNPTKDNKFVAINPSSILAYLGKRGYKYEPSGEVAETSNLTPLLAYWDIYANYYANKQEKNFYSINYENTLVKSHTGTYKFATGTGNLMIDSAIEISFETVAQANSNDFVIVTEDNTNIVYDDIKEYTTRSQLSTKITLTFTKEYNGIRRTNRIKNVYLKSQYGLKVVSWELECLNKIREDLLSKGKSEYLIISEAGKGTNPIENILNYEIDGDKPKMHSSYVQSGLGLKTYQNDIFTNYVSNEKYNFINQKGKVMVTDSSFTINALNLSQKIYNLQNRLAASSGTYKDWIEVGYTQDYGLRTETPLYEGGMSDMIVFESVVNTAESEGNPLGVLGGKGTLQGNKKGGKLHINVDEPSYIIGIVSITPIVDYSEGNDFDMSIDNFGELHIPEMDGIGYEDIKTRQVAYWADDNASYAKTTAWQNYMTNYNKVYADFAINGDMAHMCLNRYFDTGEYNNNQANTSTYINPSMYNYMFAVRDLTAMNFQVQIGWGIQARRKMSARQIPTV